MVKTVLIDFKDDRGYPLLAKTNMTQAQISEAYTTEKYDEENLDVEMKMVRYSEENGLKYEAIEFEKFLI